MVMARLQVLKTKFGRTIVFPHNARAHSTVVPPPNSIVPGRYTRGTTTGRRHAWGRDLLLPVSGGSEQWMGLGLTLVDALDTLLLMNLTAEYAEARAWIAEDFDPDQVCRGSMLVSCAVSARWCAQPASESRALAQPYTALASSDQHP